jgi:hypothetical protein
MDHEPETHRHKSTKRILSRNLEKVVGNYELRIGKRHKEFPIKFPDYFDPWILLIMLNLKITL